MLGTTYLIVGAVIFLAGMIANEILRRYDVNQGKMQLPDEKPKNKNRRKEDYA